MAQGRAEAGKQPRTPPASNERVIALVDRRRRDSLQYNYSLFAKLQQWYNAYRGVWQGRISQFRNNVPLPFIFAMIQSDVARKVQTSFGAWPIVEFEGSAPEDIPKTRKNSVLISRQMQDADSMVRACDFFLQTDISGTGIARYGWKNVTRKTRYRRMEEVAPGFSIPVVYEGKTTQFNGPTWEVVDRLDFWQQPAKTRIDEMAWVIHRYWADWDDMMEDAQAEYPYFDPSAVRALKDFPLQGQSQSEWVNRKVTFRNEFDYQARAREGFAKPVEIWEMHGLVPSEFAPDGIRHRCIAIGNGRVVLKNRPSELPQKPFLAYKAQVDPFSFDGVGKAEIAYGPQMTAVRLNNQKLDALDFALDPTYIASNSANLNTQNLFTRAGRIFLVDGPADDTSIRPLIPNLQGFNASYTEIGQLWQFMQLGAGINDIIMGTQPGQRETARGFLGRQESALTRLGLESLIAEAMFVQPLGDAFRQLDRMMLPLPHQVRIIGSLATVNPITGLPYPAERVTVGVEDLAPDYACRAVGATQMIGRGVRQQNLLQLLQIVSSNPAMMQMVNWANFARQAFELFEMRNVDELLVTQVPLINQVAQQNGVSPQSVAGSVSQPLQQLSPDILSALTNNQPVGQMAGMQ